MKKTSNKKETVKPLDALVFVDTNILLDFYRLEKSKVRMEFLQLLEDNLSSLILTDQIEMEFKKNRQRVLLKWIRDLDMPPTAIPPPWLSEDQLAEDWVAGLDKAKKALKKLQNKVEGAIKQPSSDIVYNRLNAIFSHDGPYVLNNRTAAQSKIRHLARQRFSLGYPPRKNEDISIGDAINWEWMVECARVSKKALIIVTRDTDYGVELGSEVHLNDWLLHELRERVSPNQKVVITPYFSHAVKLIAKRPASQQAEAAEKQVVEKRLDFDRSVERTFGNIFASYKEQFSNEGAERARNVIENFNTQLAKDDAKRAIDVLDALKGNVLDSYMQQLAMDEADRLRNALVGKKSK